MMKNTLLFSRQHEIEGLTMTDVAGMIDVATSSKMLGSVSAMVVCLLTTTVFTVSALLLLNLLNVALSLLSMA